MIMHRELHGKNKNNEESQKRYCYGSDVIVREATCSNDSFLISTKNYKKLKNMMKSI